MGHVFKLINCIVSFAYRPFAPMGQGDCEPQTSNLKQQTTNLSHTRAIDL